MIRTEEVARRDIAACDALAKSLAESHGLREYWAEGVYYGEYTIEEALKAQEESDRNSESLREALEESPRFITSIEEFDTTLEALNNT